MYLIYIPIGPCHSYIQTRDRTGVWQDCHCPHRFKIASKMQSVQESVSDPSNIIHSLVKRPILHICDGACTSVEFEFVHYPKESELCFGDRKGCFQIPVPGEKPTRNIDCKVSENKGHNCGKLAFVCCCINNQLKPSK